MITLTVKNLKTKKSAVEILSLDKTVKRLNEIKHNPTKWSLEGASYETHSEKDLLSSFIEVGD